MSGPRVERARQIMADLLESLEAAGLDDVTVTFDGTKVPAASRLRSGSVILLKPPSLTFPTYDSTEIEWSVVIVSGPHNNVLAAWDRIDTIIEALAPQMDFADATPADFQPLEGPTIPAYALTYNDPTP